MKKNSRELLWVVVEGNFKTVVKVNIIHFRNSDLYKLCKLHFLFSYEQLRFLQWTFLNGF